MPWIAVSRAETLATLVAAQVDPALVGTPSVLALSVCFFDSRCRAGGAGLLAIG